MDYKCKQCGETDKTKMMSHGQGRKCYCLCKKCHNLNTIARGRSNKLKYVNYKGGCCEKCGYNKCIDALDFHHTSNEKDLNFTSMRYWKFERAKLELDKCQLLCSNCHREAHAMGD